MTKQTYHHYESNDVRNQIVRLALMSGNKKVYLETIGVCPYCNERAMRIKEHYIYYYCSACGRTGDLDDLEHLLLSRLQNEKKGVMQ